MLEHGIDVRFELRTALQVLRAMDRQQACLADALKLAESLGDQRRLGYALMFWALRATLAEDYAEGFCLGHRALDIGEALDDLGIRAGTLCYLGITNMATGRFPEAVRLCEAAIALIPPERTHERFGQARPISSLARAGLGIALGRLGRFSDALAHATTARQIATDADQAYSLSSAAYALGNVWLLKGEYENAARDLEQSIEVWHTLQAPRWNPPVKQYRAAMALADELGMRPLVSHCHLGLGKLYRRTDKRASRLGIISPRRRGWTARWE